MQDALEVRVAHADLVHVIERVADVVDARPADADALRHQPRAAVQVELAHVGGMRRIGDEGQGLHFTAGGQADWNQFWFVHTPRHLPIPEARERAAQARRVDAVGHAPARAAAAQAHDEAGLAVRAAVSCRQDAKRAVVAMRAAKRLVLVVEARRPHERAIAEYPEIALGQPRSELAELHGAGIIESARCPHAARRSQAVLPPRSSRSPRATVACRSKRCATK